MDEIAHRTCKHLRDAIARFVRAIHLSRLNGSVSLFLSLNRSTKTWCVELSLIVSILCAVMLGLSYAITLMLCFYAIFGFRANSKLVNRLNPKVASGNCPTFQRGVNSQRISPEKELADWKVYQFLGLPHRWRIPVPAF